VKNSEQLVLAIAAGIIVLWLVMRGSSPGTGAAFGTSGGASGGFFTRFLGGAPGTGSGAPPSVIPPGAPTNPVVASCPTHPGSSVTCNKPVGPSGGTNVYPVTYINSPASPAQVNASVSGVSLAGDLLSPGSFLGALAGIFLHPPITHCTIVAGLKAQGAQPGFCKNDPVYFQPFQSASACGGRSVPVCCRVTLCCGKRAPVGALRNASA
jgi:hypothetical protein